MAYKLTEELDKLILFKNKIKKIAYDLDKNKHFLFILVLPRIKRFSTLVLKSGPLEGFNAVPPKGSCDDDCETLGQLPRN